MDEAVVVLATAAPAAYALARLEFRGKRLAVRDDHRDAVRAAAIIFLARRTTVIQASSAGSTPCRRGDLPARRPGAFGVFFLRQFFIGLPRELEEAALLDGANRWQIFWRIVLPLSTARARHAVRAQRA